MRPQKSFESAVCAVYVTQKRPDFLVGFWPLYASIKFFSFYIPGQMDAKVIISS